MLQPGFTVARKISFPLFEFLLNLSSKREEKRKVDRKEEKEKRTDVFEVFVEMSKENNLIVDRKYPKEFETNSKLFDEYLKRHFERFPMHD